MQRNAKMSVGDLGVGSKSVTWVGNRGLISVKFRRSYNSFKDLKLCFFHYFTIFVLVMPLSMFDANLVDYEQLKRIKKHNLLLTVFKTLFLGFAWLASLIVKSLIILGKLSNLTTYQLPVGRNLESKKELRGRWNSIESIMTPKVQDRTLPERIRAQPFSDAKGWKLHYQLEC
ncbi:hypothetical protein AB4K20DRAFT_1990290 [Rhizopus microsporus]